ncbi:MAG: ABC transporter substrate-binding protein [Actinomycetota bacterium]
MTARYRRRPTPRRTGLRRLLWPLVAALAVLAAGCGDDDASSSADPQDVTTEALEDVEAATSTSTVEATTSAAPSDVDEVTLASGLGEVTVPITTQRVVALDEFSAVMLVSLGVTPHAVANFRDDPTHLSVVESSGIELLEYGNLEVLAAAEPSMIVGVTGHSDHRDLGGPLVELAPTFLTDPDDATWQGQLRALALVTGTGPRAESIIELIEARIDALSAQVRESEFDGSVISIITEFGPNDFWVFAPPVLSAVISDEVGFRRPPEQAEADPGMAGFIQLSAEVVPSQVADITISMAGPLTGGASALDNDLLPESPVAVDVDGFGWGLSSPLTAWWILDDFESILFGDGSTYVSADAVDVWEQFSSAAAED